MIQGDETLNLNDGSFSIEPVVRRLHRLSELVKEKSKTGQTFSVLWPGNQSSKGDTMML